MKTMTALQYQTVIQQLPNPAHQYKLMKDYGKPPRIVVAILKDPPNSLPVIIGLPGQELQPMMAVEQIEFELVTSRTIWFWQPVGGIHITPMETGDYRPTWESKL